MSNIINADNGSISGVAGLKYSADTSGALVLQTNGTNALAISTSQKIGIGTASPVSNLDIYSTAAPASLGVNAPSTYSAILSLVGNGNTLGTSDFTIFQSGSNSDATLLNRANANLTFGTNNTERMRIDSSGNVLIATTSYTGVDTGTQRLTVQGIAGGNGGTLGLISDSLGRNIVLTDSGKTQVATYSLSSTIANIGTNTSLPLAFNTAATERMRIDSSGNVGIGVVPSTYNIGKAIEVGASGNAFWTTTNDVYLTANTYYQSNYKYATSNYASMYEQTSGTHRWFVAPSGTANAVISYTEAMRIDSSGNVGIGTSSNSTNVRLQVVSPTNTVAGSRGNAYIYITETAGIDKGAQLALGGQWSGGEVPFSAIAGRAEAGGGAVQGYMQFSTINPSGILAERMRLDSNGNLLVGTTTSTAKFTLTGGGQTSYFTQSSSGGYVCSMSAANNASNYYYVNWLEGATSRGAVTSNGVVMIYGGTSDYRLKENIKPMTNGLERVSKLKPVTYTWKENGKISEGFIAHELQEVVPDAVSGKKDQVDSDGNPMYQNIDPRMIVATLTVAIQEQQVMIEELKAEVAVLKAK
jgi:uncharacterized protein YaiE (UPF0345 family)